ncbi:MAG: response regulator [Acidobacteriota bacterium]
MSSETPPTPAPETPLPNVPLIYRPGAAAAAALQRAPLAERKQLLVVDDERPVLNLVVRTLQTENYAIRSAESPEEAIRLLDADGAAPVDLLVTDLKMPGMSGRELAEVVRARYPSVRVLYQTGFADRLFAGQHELGSGEAFIEKPFSIDGLLEATRLLMQGYIASSEVPSDGRDTEDWVDRRLRARVVRLLRRLGFA